MANKLLDHVLGSLKNDALVTIFVGTDETQYTVQRTLLTSASDWFVKALIVVEHFLCYLFHGRTLANERLSSWDDETHQLLCVDIWLFADEHFIPKLQNEAMRDLYKSVQDNGASTPTLITMLENAPEQSQIGRLAMNELVESIRTGNWERPLMRGLEDLPEIHMELTERLAQIAYFADGEWPLDDVSTYLVEDGT